MGLKLVTFGFRYRLPPEKADLVFDCRHQMPNPFWDLDLRPFCGEDEPVIKFLSHQPEANYFLARAIAMTSELLKKKKNVLVAVGCTGGYHRSVYIARQMYIYFSSIVPTTIEHLDIVREGKP